MTKERQNKEDGTGGANTQSTSQPSIDHNLRFYSQGREVPSDALKPIRAGRLKGMSDVNPMWRMKRMTEIFGPCGFGWKYEITKQWTEEFILLESKENAEGLAPKDAEYDDEGKLKKPATPAIPATEKIKRIYEIKCFCNVLLYVRDPTTKEWSAPIPGSGGAAIVSNEAKGTYVNDEGYKMALTDALSIAMKPLGIGANVWYGPKASGHNESKYEASTYENRESQQAQQPRGTTALAYTGEQLEQAVAEMNSCVTEAQFNQVWHRYSTTIPALCSNGTEFYKAACEKINAIKAPR